MPCILDSLAHLRDNMRNDPAFKRDATIVAIVDSLTVVAIVVGAYFCYRWWSTHPLYGRNNGPKVYPLVGSIIPYLMNRERVLDFHTKCLQEASGYTTRSVRPINRAVFITADPANIEYLLRINFANYPKGNFIYWRLRPLLGDGIFTADGHLWKIQRKVASHEFTTRSLNDFGIETARRQTKLRLLPVLSAAAQADRTLDMQDILFRFSFDGICQLGFGVDPACLSESLPDIKFAEAFDSATRMSFKSFQAFPSWLWTLKMFFDVGDAKKLRLAVSSIDEFAMEVIENRRKELASTEAGPITAKKADDEDAERLRGGRTDLLSRFMTLVNINDDQKVNGVDVPSLPPLDQNDPSTPFTTPGGGSVPRKPSNVFLRDMVISFVLAGRDSSTSALSWFFWLLSLHREVESAILEEISAVLKSRRKSDFTGEGNEQSDGSDFTFQELKGMNYLTAAITESMRLYPPVPLNFKTAMKADVLPDGTKIPAGSAVGYHPYAMGRLEGLWGKDCLSFKPERWLNDQGVFVPGSPYKYPVFQAGPRSCLGKDLIMMQMKLLCVAVLKNFQLVISPDFQPEYVLSLTLRMKHGLPVKVRRRIASSSPNAQS